MSIFDKLANLNTNKAAKLLERHPLSGEALELRLQYLAGIALGTAVDRTASAAERQAFLALATSLSVDAADAEEQFSERGNVSEDDIGALFDAIRQKNAGWMYIMDVVRMHAADKNINQSEQNVAGQLADLIGLDKSKIQPLASLAVLLAKRDRVSIQKALFKLSFSDRKLNEYIAILVRQVFPYSGTINDRYIDNGQGALTDTQSDLMWMRVCVGQKFSDNKASGSAITYSDIDDGQKATAELNRNGFSGFSDWRLPTYDELKGLVTPKSNYPVIDENAFISNPRAWFFSSTYEVITKRGQSGRQHQMTGYFDSISSDDFVLRLCRKP